MDLFASKETKPTPTMARLFPRTKPTMIVCSRHFTAQLATLVSGLVSFVFSLLVLFGLSNCYAQFDLNVDGQDDLVYLYEDDLNPQLRWSWYDLAAQKEHPLETYGQPGDIVGMGTWTVGDVVERARVKRQFKGELRLFAESVDQGTPVDIVPDDAEVFVGGRFNRDPISDVAIAVRRRKRWQWRLALNPLGQEQTKFILLEFGQTRSIPLVLFARKQRLGMLRVFSSKRAPRIKMRGIRRSRVRTIRIRTRKRVGEALQRIQVVQSTAGRADTFLAVFANRVQVLSRRGRLLGEVARQKSSGAIVALWQGDRLHVFEQQGRKLVELGQEGSIIPLNSGEVRFVSRVTQSVSQEGDLSQPIPVPTSPPQIITATSTPRIPTPPPTPSPTLTPTSTNTPIATPTRTVTPSATATHTATASSTPNQAPLGQVICIPGDQAGELGSNYSIACGGAYELEGGAVSLQLVNVTGDCPKSFNSPGRIQGTFSATAGSCSFQVEACDAENLCGARSPVYTLHSYELAIAPNGSPAIDANCNLTVPLTVTTSPNVSGLTYSSTLSGLDASGLNVDATGVQGSLLSGGTLSGQFRASSGVVAGLSGVNIAKEIVLSVGVVSRDTNESPYSVMSPNEIVPGRVHSGVQLVSDRNGADCIRCTGDPASVSAGVNHTCAIAPNNTVWCWGDNTEGQLGDGTTTRSFAPVQVVGLSDVRQVSAGSYHSCAVRRADGSVWCWGNNQSGQLGDNSNVSSSVPVQVSSLTGVAAVEAGMDTSRDLSFTCALTEDRRALCWGSGNNGRLGTGGGSSMVPQEVINITNPLVLSLGERTAGTLQADGVIKMWGFNFFGALGDTTTTTSSTPVTLVQPSGVSLIEFSAGSQYDALLLTDQINVYERDTGLTLDETTITPRVGIQATSSEFYCALERTSGSPYCAALRLTGIWVGGANPGTTLGNGERGFTGVPSRLVQGLSEPALALSARGTHACVVQADGVVRCWGNNEFGKLGNGTTDNPATPVSAFSGIAVTQVSQAYYSTCVITTGGTVFCSGLNDSGELGDSTTTSRNTPVQVPGIANANDICGRGIFTGEGFCAIDGTEVKCWGRRFLGNNTSSSSSSPVLVQGLTDIVPVELACSSDNVCVRATTGEVRCWGSGSGGRIGDGDTDDELLPVSVPGLSAAAIALGASTGNGPVVFCAGLLGGGIECWGQGSALGDGTGGTALSPVSVVGISAVVTSISNGGSYGDNNHICASLQSGGVRCWGSGDGGALGNGITANSNVPVVVSGYETTTVTKVVVGDDHSCALRSDGQVACWGSGKFSSHGQNVWQDFSTPQLVADLSGVIDISAGAQGSCAVLADNSVRCWGLNNFGQFGNGESNALDASNEVRNADNSQFIARTQQCERFSLNP